MPMHSYRQLSRTSNITEVRGQLMAALKHMNRKDYKHRPKEIFKRMKVTTFVQLVIQVYEFNKLEKLKARALMNDTPLPVATPNTERSETTDLETDRPENGSSRVPSTALTDRSLKSEPDTARSTFQSVIGGVGEYDMRSPRHDGDYPREVDPECPYLLLDCRDADAYNSCHIITALNFPKAMLSKTMNYFTREILSYQNKPNKVIIVYDEDEKLAHAVVSTMVERGLDNVFMLSGGLKMAADFFKEGFITGTVPQKLSGVQARTKLFASQKSFTDEDIERLRDCLDIALSDRSTGSRLSKASTSSSRAGNHGNISQMSNQSTARSTASTITGRPPFR